MKTVLIEQDFEPEGILNSSYKRLVERNFNDFNSRSLFGIKRRIKNRQHRLNSGFAIALKVGVFMAILIAIFS